MIPLLSVGILIAASYTGYTLYSRHEANVQAQKASEAAKQAAEQEANQNILQHGDLSIVTFGADDAVIRPGQTTHLCYGVVNAKSVKVEPHVEDTQPSYRHCMEVAPHKTTTYTLTATGEAGQTKSSSLTINVR